MLIFFAVLHHSNARAAETDDTRKRAQELFQRGNTAFAEGNTFDAYDAYLRAFSLSASFDIACNLGRAESEMGKLPEAAEHLRYCLKHFPASTRAELRAAAEKFGDLLRKVTAQVAEIDLSVEPEGAVVSINGGVRGSAPFTDSIFVVPGSVTLVVSKPGYAAETFEFRAQAGARQQMQVRLLQGSETDGLGPAALTSVERNSRTPTPASPVPDSERSASGSQSGIRTTLVISGASATLVALGVGTLWAVQAGDAHSEFRAQRDAIQREFGAAGCVEREDLLPCQKLNESRQLAGTHEKRSLFALAGASGIGLATAGLWLLWTPEPPRVDVAVHVGQRHTGIVIKGAF